MDKLRDMQEFCMLVLKYRENQIADDEFQQLETLLRTREDARKIYVEMLIMYSVFHGRKSPDLEINTSGLLDEGLDQELWKALSEHEKTAPAIEAHEEKPRKELIQKVVYPPREKRKMNKFAIFTLVNVAAMILFILFLNIVPPKRGIEVATLTDSINAKWADVGVSMRNGIRLNDDKSPLMLREGFVELKFDNNARVTIEGPAEFQILKDDQIKLGYGCLYAIVPREAIGFTIKTPSSQIIDLGTEFGVRADFQGDISLYVMKGKTVLIAGEKSNKKTVEVTEGTAKKVSTQSLTVSDISYNDHLFVRQINSAHKLVWRGQDLDLADVVGGGNGFGTGKLDSGIETNTGRRFESPDPELVLSKVSGILSGGGSYNKVSSLPLIDGVFVPDSREGPVQISSAGHTFGGFVDGREVFWGNIFNGAWHASDTSLKHNLKLNGQTYGTRDNPALSMHSNQGITFDLQAIRQTILGGRILRFTSLFGVSETVALDPLFSPKTDGLNFGKVNCWVLIDGKERFNRNSVSYLQDVTEIAVDIRDEDRFLTLVVTESGDRRAYDWALFAKPFLLIEMNMN